MGRENSTSVTKFILLGLSSNPEDQLILFGVFTAIYLVALMGNMLIVLLIRLDSRLHTPMYFFLGNLSMVDIGYTSSTVPKMLANYLSQDKSISWDSCLFQTFFFISFGGIECLLLGVMAYDRYVAICHPLHYDTFMSRRLCSLLASAAWAIGLANSAVHTSLISILSFCRDNILHHFFCDIPPLLQLSCSNTWVNQAVTFVLGGVLVWSLSCFVFIIVSYVQIFKTVLRIPSEQGRHKAFSTCVPHLIVVSLFICTGIFAYLKPTSSSPPGLDLIVAVLYSVVPPVMNPIIYSMRNKEIKAALRKLIGWRLFTENEMSVFLPGP
uniref:Olfactory receptor n=1 Tax=Pelusios castaneus TaxID=367368 RepID=A0A8C8S6G4_9SAUR